MKKAFTLFIIIIFVFLFSVSTAEAYYNTSKYDQSYIDQNNPVRAYANELQDTYSITILIGYECLDIPTPDTFIVTAKSKPLSAFLSMLDTNTTIQELDTVNNALSHYPVDFFNFFHDSRCPKGLRILLVDKIIESNPTQNYQGYAYYADSFYNLFLEIGNFDQMTVHHELWHTLENVILNVYPNAFTHWADVNPPNFRYLNDFSADRSGYDPEYFVRSYGIITPQEDRATLIEAAFYENRDEWFAKKPFILRKLLYLNSIIHVVMDYQYEINYCKGE